MGSEDNVALKGLEQIAGNLARDVGRLAFSPPVTHVYNPLDYAWKPHSAYLRRYGKSPKEVVLLGMNPGPWGMVQTGVPFGEIAMVRDWLGLEGAVGRPANEHPKRPVEGFACGRSEVSGRRLWGWAKARFGSPGDFFHRFFVANYCPLAFLEASGRNRTPDHLYMGERRPLLELCDRALSASIRNLSPAWVIGVGRFAESRARIALAGMDLRVGRILHPSPANPAANSGWKEKIESELADLGIAL